MPFAITVSVYQIVNELFFVVEGAGFEPACGGGPNYAAVLSIFNPEKAAAYTTRRCPPFTIQRRPNLSANLLYWQHTQPLVLAVGNHSLDAVQWVAPMGTLQFTIPVNYFHAFTWQGVAVLLQPVLRDEAELLHQLFAGEPTFVVHLHSFSHRLLDLRHNLCPEYSVHIRYDNLVIVIERWTLPSITSLIFVVYLG